MRELLQDTEEHGKVHAEGRPLRQSRQNGCFTCENASSSTHKPRPILEPSSHDSTYDLGKAALLAKISQDMQAVVDEWQQKGVQARPPVDCQSEPEIHSQSIINVYPNEAGSRAFKMFLASLKTRKGSNLGSHMRAGIQSVAKARCLTSKIQDDTGHASSHGPTRACDPVCHFHAAGC